MDKASAGIPVKPPRRQHRRKDMQAEVIAWLNAPNLSQTELRHRQQTIHLRLVMLDKIDEEQYIRRYITLRTQ